MPPCFQEKAPLMALWKDGQLIILNLLNPPKSLKSYLLNTLLKLSQSPEAQVIITGAGETPIIVE